MKFGNSVLLLLHFWGVNYHIQSVVSRTVLEKLNSWTEKIEFTKTDLWAAEDKQERYKVGGWNVLFVFFNTCYIFTISILNPKKLFFFPCWCQSRYFTVPLFCLACLIQLYWEICYRVANKEDFEKKGVLFLNNLHGWWSVKSQRYREKCGRRNAANTKDSSRV